SCTPDSKRSLLPGYHRPGFRDRRLLFAPLAADSRAGQSSLNYPVQQTGHGSIDGLRIAGGTLRVHKSLETCVLMLGITLGDNSLMGDKLQFASFPENYYRNTGEKLIDLDCLWIYDHNPFVVRGRVPTQVMNLK